MKFYLVKSTTNLDSDPLIFLNPKDAEYLTNIHPYAVDEVEEFNNPDQSLKMYIFDRGWAGAGVVIAHSLKDAVTEAKHQRYDISGSCLTVQDIKEGSAWWNCGDE